MPAIDEYKCGKCGLTLPDGWGMYLYVEDGKGNRIVCPHPAEVMTVEQVLGKGISLDVVRERTGFNSCCICLDCLYQFEADLGESYCSPYDRDIPSYIASYKPRLRQEKDKRECPKCKSKSVKTALELVGEACPKCKEGIIEETWTGSIS